MEHVWHPMTISQVATRFESAGVPWWVAGGRAIDLFLGWESRDHADLDVEMFRSDRSVLFDVFSGWDLHVVSESGPEPWSDPADLGEHSFGVWLRPSPDSAWALEVMLADGDRSEWRFRRDPTITMSGDRLIATSADGVPYCTPEVQLLYKSKMARAKDDVDLAHCLHRLSRWQRQWLADAIAKSDEHHPWVGVLEASQTGLHE